MKPGLAFARSSFARSSYDPVSLLPGPTISILPGVMSSKDRQIIHVESGNVFVERAHWCDGFLSKMKGFTFRRTLAPGEGLVLVETNESRISTGVTMLFTFLDLGVVWVNSVGEIVDFVLAKPWRLSYMSKAPAQYAVEVDPSLLELIKVGDHLRFTDVAEHN